ncbi:MAG: transcriptional regulator GcvA [Proteobacteria bacterium]|nr:transcriptional regulator GcvA [Pseudomonadota bacterium]
MADQPAKLNLNRRFVPSLPALMAFEASARLSSFTRAAEELNLTQGAISRQIKVLEDQLGVTLFERIRQRLVLTEAGTFYANEIRQTLDRFASATVQAMSFRARGGVLRLGMLPTFGTRWLIPRLPDFFAAHRSVTINFSSHIRQVDFQRDVLDAAIHFGEPHWPGVFLHKLTGEELFAVASPKLIKREKIKKPADLANTTLLVQATRPEAWKTFFDTVGMSEVEPRQVLEFEVFGMVLRAAVAELGVALVPKVLVQQELDAGELVTLFDKSIMNTKAYFLAYPRERANYPPLVAFRDWLLSQVRA